MSSLSKRLCLIGKLVPEGARVCDVGTDHGYLPAALVKSGRAKSVVATDIREKPLQNAGKNLERLGVENVRLILGDGLSGVSREEADVVIIAGMGAEVIGGILSRCDFIKDESVTLLLQPMTSAEWLRDYLAAEGFALVNEVAVEDADRIYSVMVARYNGVVRTLSSAERYVGLITAETDDGRRYLEKQYRRCRECEAILRDRPDEEARLREFSAAAEGIQKRLEESHAL